MHEGVVAKSRRPPAICSSYWLGSSRWLVVTACPRPCAVTGSMAIRPSGNRGVRAGFVSGSPSRETMERTVQLMAKVVCERRVAQSRPHVFAGRVHEGDARPGPGRSCGGGTGRQEDTWYTSDETSAAFSIATDGATAARILRILEENSDLCQTVLLLGRELRDHRLRRIVQQAILTKNKRLLFRLAGSTRLVTACEVELPSCPISLPPPIGSTAIRSLYANRSGNSAESWPTPPTWLGRCCRRIFRMRSVYAGRIAALRDRIANMDRRAVASTHGKTVGEPGAASECRGDRIRTTIG